MGKFQTSVQNQNAIPLGSCKLEIENWPGDFLDMVDVGILSGAVLTIARKTTTITPDNAPEIPVEVRVTGGTVKATLLEWSLDTLEKLGVGTVVSVAGTPVSGATKAVAAGAWSYGEFIPVTDEPSAAITGVSGGTDGPLVENTDYIVVTTAEGATGIIVIDSATVTTEDQAVTVTYGYTPIASKSITLGGVGAAPVYVACRLTNTNAAGKQRGYRLYKAQFSADIEHTYNSDDEAKPSGLPITLTVYVDYSRAENDQVVGLFDEQAV